MKTRLLFAGLVASAVFAGCSNDDLLSTATEGAAQKSDFALISDAIGSADTKMSYEDGAFKWEIGDEIGLSRIAGDGKNVNTNTMFQATKVTDDAEQDLKDWAENGEGAYAYFETTDNSIFGANYVVYYPYNAKFAEEGQGKVNATLKAAQLENAADADAHVAADGFMMSTATHFDPGQKAETFKLYPVFSRIAVTVKAPSVADAELQTVVLRSVDGSKIFPTKATIDADITVGADGYLNSAAVVGDAESMVSEIVLSVDGVASINNNDGYTATMTVIPGQYKNVEFYIVTSKGAYTSEAYTNAPLEAGKRNEFTFTITDAELTTDRLYYAGSAESWNYAIEKIGSMTNNEMGPATIKVLNDIEVESFRASAQPKVNVPVTVKGEGTITITTNSNLTYWPNLTFDVPVNYGANEAGYVAGDKITFNEGIEADAFVLDEEATVIIKGGKIGTATINSDGAVLTAEGTTFTGAVEVKDAADFDAKGNTSVTFTDCVFNGGISVTNNDENSGVNAVTINGASIERAKATDPASTLTIGTGTARNNTVVIEGEVIADAVNVAAAYTGFKSTLEINGDLTTGGLTKVNTGVINVNKDASLTLGETASYTLADQLLKVEGTLTNNGTINVTNGKLVDIDQNNGNTGKFINNGKLLTKAGYVWYENQYITPVMDGGEYIYTGIADEKAFVEALAAEGIVPTGLQVTAAAFDFSAAAFKNAKDFSNVDVIFNKANAAVTVPDGLKLGYVEIANNVTINAKDSKKGAAITTGDLVVNVGKKLTLGDKLNVTCVNLNVMKGATLGQGAQVSYTGANLSEGTITGTPVQK